MLEVDDADFARVNVKKKVPLIDVGVEDGIVSERGHELLHIDCERPIAPSAPLIPLRERNGSISSHEYDQVRDSNLQNIFSELATVSEDSWRLRILKELMPHKRRLRRNPPENSIRDRRKLSQKPFNSKGSMLHGLFL